MTKSAGSRGSGKKNKTKLPTSSTPSTPPTMATASTPPTPVTPPADPRGGAASWYEVLEVTPACPDADLKKAYERALALVEGRTIGGYFLLDPMAVDSARTDIEAAWAVLGDPEKRAAYDARLGDASTLVPVSSQETLPETPAAEVFDKDEITATDARRMLGIPSTPSGEGVFAPLSPEARAAVAAAEAAPPAPSPPSLPPTPAVSGKPKPALKFLSPVVEGEPRPPAPPARKPVISFALPQTDHGESSPPPPAPTSSPPTSSPPTSPAPKAPATAMVRTAEMVATATVLPTAAMPAPVAPAALGSTLTSSEGAALPVAATPSPMPGLFSLEGAEVNGQLLKRLREGRGLSLEAMVEATKIRKPYLLAIEEQDIENLPARVYLRGFLTQIARVLRVDKVKLAEGYLAFVARYGK